MRTPRPLLNRIGLNTEGSQPGSHYRTRGRPRRLRNGSLVYLFGKDHRNSICANGDGWFRFRSSGRRARQSLISTVELSTSHLRTSGGLGTVANAQSPDFDGCFLGFNRNRHCGSEENRDSLVSLNYWSRRLDLPFGVLNLGLLGRRRCKSEHCAARAMRVRWIFERLGRPAASIASRGSCLLTTSGRGTAIAPNAPR